VVLENTLNFRVDEDTINPTWPEKSYKEDCNYHIDEVVLQ
jgi:hypothetical protein